MIKAGIVGMGVIGQHIAKAIDNGIPGVTLAGVSVRTATTAGGFAAYSLDELIRKADLIVEAATQAALLDFGPAVLTAGKHLMVLSVGGLVGVLDEWARLAEQHGCRILVPSGAIAGLDGDEGRARGRDHRGHHGDAQAAPRPRGRAVDRGAAHRPRRDHRRDARSSRAPPRARSRPSPPT